MQKYSLNRKKIEKKIGGGAKPLRQFEISDCRGLICVTEKTLKLTEVLST